MYTRAFLPLALVSLLGGCYSIEREGMVMESPTEGLIIGDTVRLSVMARDSTVPTDVRWQSSDRTVATVDASGLVTGVSAGVVRIQARTGDYTLHMPLMIWQTAGPLVSLAGGVGHFCALDEDGVAWCWGSSEDSQVGTAYPPDRCPIIGGAFMWCASAAIPVGTLERFSQITAGFYHTCGLSVDGRAFCWGLNDRGQLGDGGVQTRPTLQPVAGDRVFTSLTAGGRTSCGLTSDGALFCWGAEVGRPAPTPEDQRTTPVQMAPHLRFVSATTGDQHSCALSAGGETWCWGANRWGELGVVPSDSSCTGGSCWASPQRVESAPPFDAVAAGQGFTCGLTAGGAAHCWGLNRFGQLGDGTRTDRWEAAPVQGGHIFTELAAEGERACGVDTEGLLRCWGRDRAGFGSVPESVEADRPVTAAGGRAVTTTSLGLDAQCALDPSGVAWCWGVNLAGTLGNGRPQRHPPVTFPVRVIRHPNRGWLPSP